MYIRETDAAVSLLRAGRFPPLLDIGNDCEYNKRKKNGTFPAGRSDNE